MAKIKSDTPRMARHFKRSQEIVHDLYKLGEAQCLKNVAWQEHVVQYEQVTHCHFFHSVDVKGNAQNTSTHTAGHFHVLELVTAATDDHPAIYKCSPPMKWVRKRNRQGVFTKVMAPYDPEDTHTHELDYRGSEKFVPRKINMEAVKLEAMEAAKVAPIPGIIG